MTDSWKYDKTEDTPEEEAYPALQFEIVNYPADITLKGYWEQWKNGQLKIPEYQRAYVWDVKKASKLIESFFLGLPVPGVFLFKPKGLNEFHIVDGQQRIMSAIRYQDEKFDEAVFRLRGVQKAFDGIRFSDLSPEAQFKLETTVLRATIIQQLSPDDNTSVYQIFERLNTGGVNLNPMEVRQSVSFGPFVKVLKDANLEAPWRGIIGTAKPDKRLRDVELILRCLALFQFRERYDKPMKDFLNRYMEFKRNHTADYEQLAEGFGTATASAFNQLGPKPFHLRGRLNYGVLDSVIWALLQAPGIDNLPDRFSRLKADPDYLKAVSFNTSDASVIEVRLKKAEEHLLK